MEFMRHLYTTLIRPFLDYCSQLWGPPEGPSMDKLEKVQRNFLLLIPELRDKNYSEQLSLIRLQSLQRRFDRYRILYVRKAFHGLVPNMGMEIEHNMKHRLGMKVKIPRCKSKMKLESFSVRGPEIFNSLPKDIRNLDCGMDTFKIKLDEYLSMIPDTPRIDSGTLQVSNNLKEQIQN